MDVEPGWYPDPWQPDTVRYWDGQGWTEQRAPRPTPPPTPVAANAPQESMAGGYALAILLPLIGLIYGLAKWRVGGPPVVIASLVAWVLWTMIFLS